MVVMHYSNHFSCLDLAEIIAVDGDLHNSTKWKLQLQFPYWTGLFTRLINSASGQWYAALDMSKNYSFQSHQERSNQCVSERLPETDRKTHSCFCARAVFTLPLFVQRDSFFFLKKYLFLFYFIFGCAGSLFLCAGFLQCMIFSLRWLLLLWSTGSRALRLQ